MTQQWLRDQADAGQVSCLKAGKRYVPNAVAAQEDFAARTAGTPQGRNQRRQANLDPFVGSGTVAQVSNWLGRQCIGIELNPEYANMPEKRAREPRKTPKRAKREARQKMLFDALARN